MASACSSGGNSDPQEPVRAELAASRRRIHIPSRSKHAPPSRAPIAAYGGVVCLVTQRAPARYIVRGTGLLPTWPCRLLSRPLLRRKNRAQGKKGKNFRTSVPYKNASTPTKHRTKCELAITKEKTVQIKMPFLPQQRHQLCHPRRSGDYPNPKALPLARSNSLREWNT